MKWKISWIALVAFASTASLAAPHEPRFAVEEYCVDGNTAASQEQLGFLTNYTGPAVNKTRLREAMRALEDCYHGLGFTNVLVTVPVQHLTNRVVHFQVAQGKNSHPLLSTNASHEDGPVFRVASYAVDGNTVLPAGRFDFLTNYTGEKVNLSRLREGLGRLQLLYREFGFATVSVTLPQQRLTNGIVHVRIIEGRLARIAITGNRYFSSNNIQRALPGLRTNILVNTKWLQPEMDRANQNSDRQIYPVVSPADQPGYTDLTLRVKDRLPLHAHVEINDKSTPGTPLLRVDSSVQYNNLWQQEHQVGLDYQFSPQDYKRDDYSPHYYDQPMVASYSGYYRIPFRTDSDLRERYERLPVDFGYDEVTHRVNLPQPTGNPELTLYASRSSADMPVRYGALQDVIDTPLVQISSQSAERDLTVTENLGAKFTQPLREFWGIRSQAALGFDFKSYREWSYVTNLSYFLVTLTNNGVATTSPFDVALPSNGKLAVTYMPISFAWSADRPDRWGDTSFSIEDDLYLSPFESSRPNFQATAASLAAGDDYTKIIATLTREERLPKGWSILWRTSGQWASEPLISNEQFPLGGTAGVRGYQEGETYGDNGWRSTFDLRAPALGLGSFPIDHGTIAGMIRPSWFMDYGEAYILDRAGTPTVRQWGTGLGFFWTAGEHLDARLGLGWALLRTPVTTPGTLQAYFSVGLQF